MRPERIVVPDKTNF